MGYSVLQSQKADLLEKYVVIVWHVYYLLELSLKS